MQKTITIHVVNNARFFCGANPRGVDNVFLSKKEAVAFADALSEDARKMRLSDPEFGVETRRVSFASNPIVRHVSSQCGWDSTDLMIRASDIREDQKCADVCFRPTLRT